MESTSNWLKFIRRRDIARAARTRLASRTKEEPTVLSLGAEEWSYRLLMSRMHYTKRKEYESAAVVRDAPFHFEL